MCKYILRYAIKRFRQAQRPALTPEIAIEFVYHAARAIDAGAQGSQMVGTFTRRTALGGFS
jgi:hypothetical protein